MKKVRTKKKDLEIDFKLRVFISSSLKGRYKTIRREIKTLLGKTKYIETFIYEGNGASSSTARKVYLGNLKRCDLCVVIVNNKDGIGDGVKEEIECAKENEVKIMYIFCNEGNASATDLQKSLKGADKNVCFEEKQFKNIPVLVRNSIIKDMILAFCDSNIENRNVVQNHREIHNVNLKSINGKTFSKTLGILSGAYRSKIVDEKQVDNIDYYLADYLSYIIGLSKFNEKNFNKLTNCILDIHKGKFKNIIESRKIAEKHYCKGQYLKCITILENAFIEGSRLNISTWILNDIAIDLRHLYSLIDKKNNKISFSNEAQKKIDQSVESVYYPYIDRLKTDFDRDIINEYYNMHNDSYSSARLLNVDPVYMPLLKIFYTAQCFGSIVQTKLIVNRLIDLYTCYNADYYDRRLFIEQFRLLLVDGNLEKTKKLMKKFSVFHHILDKNEVIDILNTIELIEDIESRYIALMILLSTFSDILDNRVFSHYNCDILKFIKDWLDNGKRAYYLYDYIEYYLMNNLLRIGQKKMTKIIYSFFDIKVPGYLSLKIIKLLSLINFRDLSCIMQKKYMRLFKSFVEGKYIKNLNINYYSIPLVSFCLNTKIAKKKLYESLKKNNPSFYEDTLQFELRAFHKKDVNINIKTEISVIEKQIENNKSGLCFLYGDNPFVTIYNIVKNKKIIINQENVEYISYIVDKILFSENESYSNKYHALMIYYWLAINYLDESEVKKYIVNLLANINIIRKCINNHPFDKHSVRNVTFALQMIYDYFYVNDSNNIYGATIFNALEDNAVHSINTIMLYDFLSNDISRYSRFNISSIFNYLCSLVNFDDKTIKTQAVLCLLKLSSHPSIKDSVIEHLYYLMDNASVDVRIYITKYRYYIQDKKFRSTIKSKAKKDNSYRVRYYI